MSRTLTILLVGLLAAALAIGAIAPAVSAHGGTDTQTPYPETEQDQLVESPANLTDAHAAQMAQWMAARMGPEGVEAFEAETGTSIEVVAHAMAEQMSQQPQYWNQTYNQSSDAAGWGERYQAPRNYGPHMPYGPHMGPHGYGPHMSPGGFGPQMGPGTFGPQMGPRGFGPQLGPSGYGPQTAPDGYGAGAFEERGQGFFGGGNGWSGGATGFWSGGGSGGHGGHGGHGMGGGMGGGW